MKHNYCVDCKYKYGEFYCSAFKVKPKYATNAWFEFPLQLKIRIDNDVCPYYKRKWWKFWAAR